jgi:hypothetical protein
MLSLFLRRFFLSFGNNFFSVELLRPLVSVNNDFKHFFIYNEVLKKLLKSVTSLCIYSSLYAYAERTHQELMHKLSMRARHWCACWAYASGTDAYAQDTHQFSHFFVIEVLTNHAEHTRKELVHILSICVRPWCACWAYASVPYGYAQHVRQKLNAA